MSSVRVPRLRPDADAGSVQKWMPPVDGVRGLAILLALLFHYAPTFNTGILPEHLVKTVAQAGWTGVDLFFVLSGFLITGILLDSSSAENYFSSFYARRVLRIFPVYYAALLATLFLGPIVFSNPPSRWPPVHERIWYFAYLQNWVSVVVDGTRQHMMGHFWSLGVEEQFYLIWPWVVYRRSPKRVLQIAVGASLLSVLLRLVLLARHIDPEIIYRNTFTRMDTLLIGAACACLVRHKPTAAWLRRHASSRWFAWMWIAPVITLAVLHEAARPFAYQASGVQGLGFTAIALSYAALLMSIVVTMGSGSLLQRFFSSSIMRMFGTYSYAAYVWQQLVRGLLVKGEDALHLSVPMLVVVPIAIAVTFAVSACSYRIIERPFLGFKRFFKPHFKTQVPGGATVQGDGTV
jgi:peptidoglycan/LPS O-acetylase OafA/YrhL